MPALTPRHVWDLLSTAQATEGGGEGGVERAWVLFATITVLLVAFFIAIVLVTLMRWRRQRQEGPAPAKSDTNVDAWEEAGRRTKPY